MLFRSGWALARDDDLRDLTVGRPTLEDIYLQLTDGPETSPADDRQLS